MIINFSHYKGGVGKSTLTLNVATGLNLSGVSVSILDLDGLQSSILFNKLREKNGHTPIECFEVKNEEEMKVLFQQFSADDKILLVDSGGYDSEINRFAMLSADILITPVGPSQVELFALQKYTDILKQISEKSGQIFRTNVVINNADIRSKATITELKHYIQQQSTYLDLYKTVVYSRADYKKAYASGLGVMELDIGSKAAFEINQLVKEIQRDF
ncbi:division plane positioning ATPase MipZ [Pelosinus propionicus]|uniref:Chromosome partitioning protein n=1 Tax=Pelosinus propionicus DSM 13327 TaxID=1123291 RepID=A0A1I4PSN9_9FIRM|nr:division plane positioning ATPase MipZ [Pelosinus propionicus]SFM30882.1 chromosome partitioning protein [Pelosinus propionicus DSM 13327]